MELNRAMEIRNGIHKNNTKQEWSSVIEQWKLGMEWNTTLEIRNGEH